MDLKSFNDRRYRDLGGRLGPFFKSIQVIHDMGFWLDIVTLIVPGFNDSHAELEAMAKFIAGVSPDIPWHVTAFNQDYKIISLQDTSCSHAAACSGDRTCGRIEIRVRRQSAKRGRRL